MGLNVTRLLDLCRHARRTRLAVLALVAGGVVACAPAAPAVPSVSPVPRATSTRPVPIMVTVVVSGTPRTTTTTSRALALARVTATARARALARLRAIPTRPLYTPTPEPTPIPPGEELEPTANGLLAKLTALRTAMKGHDVQTSLKAQRDLMKTADAAAATLKDDKSYEAALARQAVADLKAGVAGDNNGLDHAEAELRQALGGGGFGLDTTGISANGTPEPTDPAQVMQQLADQVRQFNQAVHDGNSNDALRLQGQLLVSLSAAQQVAPTDDSEPSKALRGTLESLQKGLDGNASELNKASAALAQFAAPANAPSANVQTQAQSLESKLDAFRLAISTNDRETILRLQPDLLAEANQDLSTLTYDNSDDGAKLKDAIADIKAGAGGDLGKLDNARATLGNILGEPQGPNGAPAVNDLPKLAGDLDAKVLAFQKALQTNDTSAMLKNQEELTNEIAQTEPGLKDVKSPSAQQLTSAMGAIQAALGGDLSKLDDAHTILVGIEGAEAKPGQPNVPNPNVPNPNAQNPNAPNANPANLQQPAPASGDMAAMAKSLAAKVDAFRLAAAANNRADLLRLQPDLLSEAAQDSAALQNDTSAQGEAMKAAIGAIQDGTGGDFSKLDGARADLGKVLGEPAPAEGEHKAPNLPELAGDLQNKVAAFQQAINGNDTGAMLRIQRDLTTEFSQVDPQLQTIDSKQADDIRGAIAATQAAFAGDTSKLDEAQADLSAAKGGAPAAAGGKAPVGTNLNAAPQAPVDLHGPSGELQNRLNALQGAVNSHQPEGELAARRQDLLAQVNTAADAVSGRTGVQAEKYKDALNAAREAANGDNAKIQAAGQLLQEALQTQS